MSQKGRLNHVLHVHAIVSYFHGILYSKFYSGVEVFDAKTMNHECP